MSASTWNVSRETEERLDAFQDLVRKWNPRINLVSAGSLTDLATRHIADSILVNSVVSDGVQRWLDIGSGGGFPGIVVAILRPETEVVLMESDQRKAQFLRTARRELRLNATIHSERVESAAPQQADVVSARALAPLNLLLHYATRHAKEGSVFVFPKGQTWEDEHQVAQSEWTYDMDVFDGLPGASGKILKIRNARLRHDKE